MEVHNAEWIKELSTGLFWDVRVEDIDPEKNLRWLVERVINRGTLEDLQLILANIGRPKLRDISPSLKLAPRERNFLDFILQSDNE